MGAIRDLPGNIFGGMFDFPKPPKPPNIPTLQDLEAQASKAAAEELRRRRRKGKTGRESTILSGPQESPLIQKRTLLGE